MLLLVATTFSCSSEDETLPLNNSKEISLFDFNASTNTSLENNFEGTIDESSKTIEIKVLAYVDLKSIKPQISISEGATVSPENGVIQDFSNPVVYTVTAEDGTTVSYTVSVYTISDAKEIVSFEFKAADNEGIEEDVSGVIDAENKTVKVTLPPNSDASALLPSIVLSENATLREGSDTPENFIFEVAYVVIAEDGTRVRYTILVNTLVSDSDKNSLKAIYDANPGNTLEWDFTNDDSSSFDRVIFQNGKVVQLNLSGANLSIIPTEIGDFTNLTSLDLSGIKLNDNFPEEIGHLTELKFLDLDATGLTTYPPFLANLINLTKLNLNKNQLQTIPSEIASLSLLTSLYLEENNLNGFPMAVSNLNQMENLSLRSNPNISELPSVIGNLINLRILNLRGCSIPSLPASIGLLVNLLELNLEFNDLTTLPPEIGNMTKLENLELWTNALTSIPAEIGNLPNILFLDFTTNNLTTIPIEIGNLSSLKKLGLGINNLTVVPSDIGNLTNLFQLSLFENPINSIPKKVCDLETTGTKILKDDGVTCE